MAPSGDPTLPSLLLVRGAAKGGDSVTLLEQSARVTVVANAAEAASALETNAFDALLVELEDPDTASIERLGKLAQAWRDVPVIACGLAEPSRVRRALAAGATEFLALPASSATVALALEAAMFRARTLIPPPATTAPRLIGDSPLIGQVRDRIARVAVGKATVLLRGETGTGKELLARAIHARAARAGKAPSWRSTAPRCPRRSSNRSCRLQGRGVHRRASEKAGRVELARRGHAVPRRDQRDVAGYAGEAAARPAGQDVRASWGARSRCRADVR